MKQPDNRVQLCCDNCFDELFCLESIIKLTKNACLEKEISSNYYNLPIKYKFTLSEERNNYINMMNVALDKVNNLKKINNALEQEIQSL